MHLAVDVDEVCLQLMPEWLGRYTARSGHAVSCADITGWDVIPHLPEAWVAPFFAILEEGDLYDTVPAVPGAVDGLACLRAAGVEITFVTAGALGSLSSKRRRMQGLGLLTPADGFVMAIDKTCTVPVDAFVDDRAETILAALDAGRHGVLVAQPWNAWAALDVRAAGGVVAADWTAVVAALHDATRPAMAHHTCGATL